MAKTILSHVADIDADGDTYEHMAKAHKSPIVDDRDPVEAHFRAHKKKCSFCDGYTIGLVCPEDGHPAFEVK